MKKKLGRMKLEAPKSIDLNLRRFETICKKKVNSRNKMEIKIKNKETYSRNKENNNKK